MTKAELRKKYTQLRKTLTPGQLQKHSEAITELLFKNIQLEEKTISLFLPIERQHEINTYLIWEKARSFNAKVGVPKTNFETLEMHHYLFENEDQLALSEWGIPEPKFGTIIENELFDIVFVPLLTVDVAGNRVGYGKGFYDRFLKHCKPTCMFIGLHLFELEAEITDTNETDIQLHACVTPTQFIRF